MQEVKLNIKIHFTHISDLHNAWLYHSHTIVIDGVNNDSILGPRETCCESEQKSPARDGDWNGEEPRHTETDRPLTGTERPTRKTTQGNEVQSTFIN